MVDVGDCRHVDVLAEEYSSFLVESGDLLACRYNGNLSFVGSVAMVPNKLSFDLIYPDKLIRLRPIDIERDYLREVMNSLVVRAQIEAMAATTAGNIGINGKQLQSIAIPIAPAAEQRRIVATIGRLQAMVSELAERLRIRDVMAQALSAKALRLD